MASWLSRTAEFWNEWGLRTAVLSSLASHVALVLLANTRRRNLSLWGWLLLWPAYQIADISATYALGKLFLGGTCAGAGASSSAGSSCEEQQLVAFWAPFLLLHLGRPDNISAYALEDNTLSLRQAVQVVLQVAGTSYVLYNYIYLGHGGALLPASALMFAAGVAKYVERALALWKGNMEHMRGSSKKKKQRHQQQEQSTKHEVVRISTAIGRRRLELDHEQALRFAHDMFHFCERAMVDSSVEMAADSHSLQDHTSSSSSGTQIFSLEWMSMCKVVEMELSLMYDVLYTKASVVHTWRGYIIRIISPCAVATAATFFWLLPKGECLREADVIITYMLLGFAFLLDVVWLVRALVSTWAFAFLDARPGVWLYHAFLCRGRWHRQLRRIFVTLDPSSWLLGQDPRAYRMWSGRIGRYNLLDECTRPHGAMAGRLGRWLATMAGLEDDYYSRCMSHQLGQDVKQLLFQRIQTRLLSSYRASNTLAGRWNNNAAYSMKDITTAWGQEAVKRGGRQIFEADQLPSFGREFQEDILVWHIGTCILLVCADQQHVQGGTYGKAIEVLSEYLMFLVAVRSHMVPGLVLRSLFEVTRQAMADVWAEEVVHGNNNNRSSSCPRSRKEMLAKTLHELKFNNEDWGLNNANTRLISDGIDLATVLLQVEETDTPQLMELVFDVWIDKLLYAGTRCSRESHAKQLSHGAELTSIVWIITEHAGPFRIGETIEGTELGPFPIIEVHAPPPPPPSKPKEEPKKEEPAPPPPEKKEDPKERPPPPKEEHPYPDPYPPYPASPAPPPPAKVELPAPAPPPAPPPSPPPPMEPIESTKRKRRVKYATLYPPY